METMEVRIIETERTALTRLLAKAKAEGVKLLRDQDGRHYASSVSRPGTRHYVTAYSCDCRGFVAHQRCKHHAALLSALGWLQGDPEPDPGMAITCAHVGAHYSLEADPEWREPRTEILVDGDVKVRITGDTFGLHVHWIEGGRPIDDLTGATPSYLDHAEAVRYWIEALDARVPAHVAMQECGLFPAGEFVDAQPVAA
ncbi:MAG: hypothetical protein WKF63_01575 [Thermomicrobiales bacterium]